LLGGGLAMPRSSGIWTKGPIPNATTFVPELPVSTLFSKSASFYNVHIHHDDHHHHHRYHHHLSTCPVAIA